jgi:hypothetical protein
MFTFEEKRREERFRLEVPVVLANGTGVSRDISTSAVYFVTDQPLAAGSSIHFSMHLDYVCPGKPLQFECRGEVLRVEEAGEKFGVAASLGECWCTH